MEVHLRLVPGGEDKGLGSATPMMVNTIGRSVCSLPPEPRAGAVGATVQGVGIAGRSAVG